MKSNRKWKQLRKTLYVIPYILLFSFTDLLSFQVQDQPLAEALWYGIVGRVTAGEVQSLILSMESIGMLLLFALLYGNYISEDFGPNSIVIFSRIHNRGRWGIAKTAGLGLYSLVCALAAVLLKLFISAKSAAAWHMDGQLLWTVFLLVWTIFLILLLLGLLTNWLAIWHGTSVGILLTVILVLVLEFVGVRWFDSAANMIWNPLCFNIMLLKNPTFGGWKLAINLLYLVILFGGFLYYVNRKDLF